MSMAKNADPEKWVTDLENILGENSNPPVQLKKLFGENDILNAKTEHLDLLLKALLKANIEYDLESYVRAVSYELEKRMQQATHKENRGLAIIAIMISCLAAAFQIIEFFTCN